MIARPGSIEPTPEPSFSRRAVRTRSCRTDRAKSLDSAETLVYRTRAYVRAWSPFRCRVPLANELVQRCAWYVSSHQVYLKARGLLTVTPPTASTTALRPVKSIEIQCWMGSPVTCETTEAWTFPASFHPPAFQPSAKASLTFPPRGISRSPWIHRSRGMGMTVVWLVAGLIDRILSESAR